MSELLPLTVKGACVKRRGKLLVGPIDLTLKGRGVTIVIGPNGSGKTSLLKMLHGIARLGAGTLTWNCSQDEARTRQAFVFQQPVMLRRTVQANIAYPLQLKRTPQKTAMLRAAAQAELVGLGNMLDRPAHFLSGGERQKLALARALITQPDLLFLDEPCASLDGRATREIEEILIQAIANGARLVMSTHDIGQARRIGDEVAFLLHGRLHEFGPADQFFSQPNTPEAQAFVNGDIVE